MPMSMRINYRRRIQIQSIESKRCPVCDETFPAGDIFCRSCGTKLKSQTIRVYANWGKKGVTSYSLVFPDGKTINSKGTATINLGNGLSFTI